MPCGAPAGDGSFLPDTGQLTCRDEEGFDLVAMDCVDESNPCFGQDASYDTGCSPLGTLFRQRQRHGNGHVHGAHVAAVR